MKTKTVFFIAFLFVAMIATGQNPRNSLIEKGSSTQCDECICIDSIIQRCVLPEYPGTIMLIYHTFFSNLKCGMCDTLASYLLKDQSELRTNRDGQPYKIYGFENFYQYCDTVGDNIFRHPEAPLQMSVISKDFNPQSKVVTCRVQAKPYNQALTGTYMINAVLYENRVLADQSMSSACGGFSGSRKCYHNNVVRSMAYQFGDQVKSGTWDVNDAAEREFSFTLDPNWDPYQSFVVVYVYLQTASLVNSEIQQAVEQSVTGSLLVEQNPNDPVKILTIYPNPARDQVTVTFSLSAGGHVRLNLTDVQGRLVRSVAERNLSTGVYDIPVPTGDLPGGQYFFTVEKEGQVYHRSFVVREP